MNMMGRKRGQRGFTLIEILIVLAVLAVLAAVVVPNVAGYLGRGKARAFESDQRMLQAAVDAWRTDVSNRAAGNPWPTLGGLKGTPADTSNGTLDTPDGDYGDVGDKDTLKETGEDLNSFIDLAALATDGYLKGANAVKSAEKTKLNTTATNSPTGSYGWYIDTNGLVQAIHWDDVNNDVKVDVAETSSGFQTDVYP